ncbi:TPR repeat-containing protein ZIP4 [Hypsizygus marmoreus]|uniref:Protein ZIP4 homolog n=1 Tax=Hypsizygus marmoreus TaxID=39966 RepID=A0A369JYD0_HYPMA|nr:TPR repeat-containing protein ZIP4 [Hypsizygus marmoreus]
MSASKKINRKDLQKTYDSIKEILLTIKPKLNDPKPPTRPSLTEDLHRVASLAESFTEQRPKSNKSWVQFADSLDQEGVNLWNISGLIRKVPEDDGRSLIAALRLAAFRLVEAGLEVKPGIDGLLHVLQLASKTGATLSEIGSHDVAAKVLTSAAKFEELLRNMDDADGVHRHAIACGTVVYLCSRMEAAWREKNLTVVDFMSQKITDDDQRLALLPPHLRQLLASKFHRIGKSMLEQPDGTKPTDAVVWLQKAFSLADPLEDSVAPGVAELKITVLQALARAYFISGSYDQAEATLEELVPFIDSSPDHESSEYRELRWLRLATLKRRKAGDTALIDAFKSIINHMDCSETNITDVLQDLRTLYHQHSLVTAVHQHCLQKALQRHGSGAEQECVDRLLLSLIFHCAKDEDHERAMKTIDTVFTSLCQAEVELASVPTTACLTLLWQYGDRHYHAKKWSEAADWFVAGSHKLFRTNSPATSAKCFRKATLCYIEQREYARASTVIRRCPTNEAKTHYVIFLIAVHQGLEDEAIGAVREMLSAPDFDRNMLLLATQISHQSEMKGVLLSVLEALLKTLKLDNSGETVVEAMTLIRCIIRLALGLLVDPTANRTTLIDTVVNHFQTARILTQAASAQKAISLISKDVSWLWRTAYNCAVQGCSEWEHSEERISDLFNVARDLLEALCQASPVDVDPELFLHLINASFSAVSGHVFSTRETLASDGKIDVTKMSTVTAEIKACKERVTAIMKQDKIHEENDVLRVQYFIHTLQVFQAECLAHLKAWDQLSQLVEEIVNSGPLALSTYEAIADILWADKDCPINVLYGCLEALLRASLDHNYLSVEKFSRWLRAICTIILARNTPEDRVKAIGYVEQALTVIEHSDDSDEPYPMDERQWLLATSYNTGAECLHGSMLDEAKRWFEASTIICRFVPGGRDRAEKISETYTHLLSRYGPK